jgi:hypothetical protein
VNTQHQLMVASLPCYSCGAEVGRLPGTPDGMVESMCPACIRKYPIAMCMGCKPDERTMLVPECKTVDVVAAHFSCNNGNCPVGKEDYEYDRKNWFFHDSKLPRI